MNEDGVLGSVASRALSEYEDGDRAFIGWVESMTMAFSLRKICDDGCKSGLR